MGFFNSSAPRRQLCCVLLAALLLTPLFSTTTDASSVLFITRNNGTWTAQEILRRDLFIGWGHTILPLHQGVAQASYDAAVDQADVAFYGEETNSTQFGFTPLDSCIGAVIEEDALSDEFGLAATSGNYTNGPPTTTYINGPGHYITAGFPSGDAPMFNTREPLHYLRTNIAPGLLTLSRDGTVANLISLSVLEIGAQLYTGGTAAARRVWLPWGASNMDFTSITPQGETIMRRSLEWAAQVNTCSRMSKRAFLTDGTPIADGSTLPIGTNVNFLLYINNAGGIKNDVSVQDVLDPAFLYQASSMRVDNSLPQCATSPCTAAEEAAIFTAVKAGSIATDTINGDVASISGSTINAGNAVAANGQLDIAANRIWALLFSVTIQ